MQNKTLIKREFWVLDQACKFCAQCQKPFKLLIRGRHHCRQCGKVFCNDCSNFFIDSSFFQLEKADKKPVRFCRMCFEQISHQIGESGEVQKGKLVPKVKQSVAQQSQEIKKGSVSARNLSTTNEEEKTKAMNILQIFTSKQVVRPKTGTHANTEVAEGGRYSFDSDPNQSFVIEEVNERETVEIGQHVDGFKHQVNDIKNTVIRLETEMQIKLKNIVEISVQNGQINESWGPLIYNYLQRAVNDIKVDAVPARRSMDINHYIKIKRIPYINNSATDYLWGIVCRKNVVHKKMRTFLQKPKIMIVETSLDMDTSDHQVSFQDMLNRNEQKILDNIVDKIVKIGPDIIFVEKNVNITVIQKLQKKEISVAQGMKKADLEQIRKTTGARAIKKISDLDRYDPAHMLGTCDKLIFRSYDPKIILNDKATFDSLSPENVEKIKAHIEQKKDKDPTLLFIKNNEPSNCVTITLSSPHFKELERLKPLFRTLLRLAYHLKLEKEMISMDLRFQRKLIFNCGPLIDSVESTNELMLTCGSLTDFIYAKVKNEQELLNKDYLEFAKIKYTEINIKNFPDIDSIQDLNHYVTEHNDLFNHEKLNWASESCETQSKNRVRFYSSTDQPLGNFIMLKVVNQEVQCIKCKTTNSHVTVYYGPNVYVRVSVEKNNYEKGRLQFRQSLQRSIDRPNLSLETGGDQSSIQFDYPLDQQQPTILQQPLKKIEKKDLHQVHKDIKKMNIVSFLECEVCRERLTESLKMPKATLEYSLFRFIYHLMLTCFNQKRQKNLPHAQQLVNNIPCVDESGCRHEHISRVFLYEQTKVKFYCNTFNTYKVKSFQIRDPDVQTHVERNRVETIETRKTELLKSLEDVRDVLMLFIKKVVNHYGSIGDTPANPFIAAAAQPTPPPTQQQQSIRDHKRHQLKKVLLRKLEDIVTESTTTIESTQFREFLHIEYESMKIHTKLSELQYFVKDISRRCDEQIYRIANPLVKATIIKQNEGGATNVKQTNEIQPAREGMLAFLINTKVIEREVQKHHKKEQRVRRSERKAMVDSVVGNSDKTPRNMKQSINPPKRLTVKPSQPVSSSPPVHQQQQIDAKTMTISNIYSKFDTNGDLSQPMGLSQEIHQNSIDEKAERSLDKHNETNDFQMQTTTFGNDDPQNLTQIMEPQFNHQQSMQTPLAKDANPQQAKKEYKLNKIWPRFAENFNEPRSQQPTFFPFVPLYASDDMACIAYALNSSSYYQLYQRAGFASFEDSRLPNNEDPFFENLLLDHNNGGAPKIESVLTIKVQAETYKTKVQDQDLLKLQLFNDQPLQPANVVVEEDPKDNDIGKDQKIIQENNSPISPAKLAISTANSIPASKTTIEGNDSGETQPKDGHNTSPSQNPKENSLGHDNSIMGPDQNQKEPFQEEPDESLKTRVNFSCKVNIYYPAEFEAVRMVNNISIYQFIRSISSCYSWDSSGGKSGAGFFKSADNLFVFKQVKESEFFMFDEFAPKYFEHVHRNIYQRQSSVLNKHYGMFEIETSKGSSYFIAMENLFYGMSGDLITYDLKGSQKSRWNQKQGKQTLLDTNYRVDRNGEPLPIQSEQFCIQINPTVEQISKAFVDDSDFLCRCRVVDYSLLLIINPKTYDVKMGIIDWLQQFNLKKQLENRAKKMINLGQDPTIVPENEYRDRFQKWMKNYFMEAKGNFQG